MAGWYSLSIPVRIALLIWLIKVADLQYDDEEVTLTLTEKLDGFCKRTQDDVNCDDTEIHLTRLDAKKVCQISICTWRYCMRD